MIRDKFKDEDYFTTGVNLLEQNILKEKERIEKAEADTGELLYRNNYYIMANGYCMYIFVAYSLGKPVNTLVDSCKEMLKEYVKSWHTDIDYSDSGDIAYTELLSMVSIGILLNTKEELLQLFNLIVKVGYKDYLVDYLFSYVQPGIKLHNELIWNSYNVYKRLKQITQSDKTTAEAAMKDYLQNYFYTKENLEDDYGSHKRNNNDYDGYWSFEAAAITKIMGLDDSSYIDNPYYPKDMLHGDPPGYTFTPLIPQNPVSANEPENNNTVKKKKWWQI